MAGKIVVAGHICLDITPVFDMDKVTSLDKILEPGKLVQLKSVTVNTGGAVANTGLALQILGADVEMAGKIGNDEFGRIILNKLDEYPVQNHVVIHSECSTSFSVVISPPGIDRCFLHNSGANDSFGYGDLDFDSIGQAELFHLGYPTIMKKLYQNEGEELEKIFHRVKAMGLLTSMDMASIDEASDAALQDWDKILSRVLPYVDFFVPSVEELCFMVDRERYGRWRRKGGGSDVKFTVQEVLPLAEKMLEKGAAVVLVKCGAAGMLLKTAEKERIRHLGEKYAAWSELEIFEKSYCPKQLVSATGAGDTSIAAFLKAVLDGYMPWECLQLAAATGACCVEAYDALSGLRPFPELQERIKKGWKKL